MMRRRLLFSDKNLIISFLFLIFLLQGPALADDGLSHILEGIRKGHNNLPGLSVRYTREVITRSMGMLGNQFRGDLARGIIYFKPPSFLRMEQEKPEQEILVADKDTVWWYIPGKKRVYEYPSQELGKEIGLLSDIFQGLVEVEQRFHVIMLDRNKQGECRIQLRPAPPWQEIEHVILTVTGKYEIRIVEVHNLLGSVTRFELEGLAEKERFDEDFFKIDVPEGVELVKDGRR